MPTSSKKRASATEDSPRPNKQRRVTGPESLGKETPITPPRAKRGRKPAIPVTKVEPLQEVGGDEPTSSTNKSVNGTKKGAESPAKQVNGDGTLEKSRRGRGFNTAVVKEEYLEIKVDKTESPNPSRKSKETNITVTECKGEVEVSATPKKSRKVKATESPARTEAEKRAEGGEDTPQKVKRHRKTKEEKEADAMPLAERTNGLRMFIGAHVSAAKGVHNSVTNAVHIGGNSFALFLKSQRKWENPPLQDDHKDLFHANCKEHRYESNKHVLPHGSYLVNLAQDEPAKAKQAYDAFVDDLKRCEALGIKLYNFHPGTTGPRPRPEAISRIAAALNRAHKETSTVKPLLENMAGKGNVIGATFEDLHDIIEEVEDKSRIGVCIDTCHSFAAGYDLRSPEAFKKTLQKFDEVVGMKYLSALHINDSKAPFASHRDLHQNIGLGFLGLRAFHNVMNEPRFEGLPLVLETPIEKKDDNGKVIEDKSIWAAEIKLLERLIGMDPESDEFKTLERNLAAKGAEERAKHQEAFDRKLEKERKAIGKGKPRDKNQGSIAAFLKKKRKKGEESDDSQSSLSDISD